MNATEFETILSERITLIRDTLGSKAAEYASDRNRLHNFHRAADFQRITPAQVCWNFAMKHLVSIQDMVESDRTYPETVWAEKLGDAINYLILLEAITHEGGYHQ